MKKIILLLFAALALHGWSQTYSTSTLDFTSRATLVAMWFHDLPQSSTQVYMINDEEHSYEINSVTFYRCGALIDNCLIIFGSQDAATVSGWDAEDGRVEIRPTSNELRITKVEVFTRDGDGYKIGISDPYNLHPNTLTEHSSSVTWQDAAASTIIIQAKPDYSGTTYINQIRVTYADGGQAYACDVNRDGKVDPEDANTIAKDYYYYIHDQTYDAIEWTWGDTNGDGYSSEIADYLDVVQYLIDNNPMNLDVASYAGLGDVTGNGVVDYRDANKILEFAFTPDYDVANSENIANDWVCDDPTMDLNGDGKCDAWDYVIIQMLIKAGYTTPIPDVEINEVNFPDANFRAYVLQNIDLNGDAKLQPGEANRVTILDVHESGITTLKGIEYFTRLTELDASYNHNLASPDLSQNTVLQALNLEGCDLATLDVSHNTALTRLNCSNCALTTLDLSACTQLDEVRCQYNQLTSLDVSTCTALTFLACNNNRLATLDVSHNTALATLFGSNNQLSELNVQANGSLVTLACEVNRLTSLDLSHNPQLRTLQFYGNRIGADAMNALIASLPQVSSEAGDHGTMQPYSERPEHAEGNVFSVRNACDALAKNWTSIEYVGAGDPYYVEYAVEINEANFPDAGFRAAVGEATIDQNLDGWLQAGEMTRTILSVGGSNIADLTGIEFFPLMQTLTVVNLQLTTIDLSHTPCIRTIFCHHNQLKGDGVDAMIASLPTLPAATGSICGVWDNHDTMGAETNRFTPEQVAAAAAKGWVIKSFEGLQWVNYEGYPHIVFESEVTKAAIVALFDSGHNGELSYDEAAAVTNQTMFQVRQQLKEATLEQFDEFRYFTGVTDLFGAGNPFAYNTTLKSITLPASITSVTASAFRGCTALERVDFLAPTITVMQQSFINCTSLKSFPFDRVTSIGNYAFYNTALGSVTLPASVENIGYMAFYGDSSIDLTLLADGYEVFSGTGTDAGLHLPVVSPTGKLRINRNYFSQAYSTLQGSNESVTLQPFIKMEEWANEDVTPFSCDVPVELPAGSTIHIVNGLDHTEGAERALTARMPGTVVPAVTGVMVKLPERNNYESKIWFLNQTTATASGDYSGNLLQPALAEANLDPVEGWTHMRWEVMYETEVPITCWRATDDPIWVQGGSAYVRVPASEWPYGMSGIPYLVDLDTARGDINGDGTVDVNDVNILINITLGKAQAGSYRGNADVSGDGIIDVADVNTVINIVLGKQ